MLFDLTPLLDAIERNTLAAERLAGALEQAELTLARTEEPLETPQHFNVPTMPTMPTMPGFPMPAAAPAPAPAEGDKPKRKRRTKAEIAADEAAAAMGQPAAAAAPAMPAAFGNFTASPTPPVVLGSGVAAQVLQQAQATAQAAVQLDAQATAQAAVQAAQASSAFTAQAQAPAHTQPSAPAAAAVAPAQLAQASVQRADLSQAALQYQQLPADQQFGHLNALFMQANNALPVRDALVGAVKAAGIDLPISDQADRSKPSAGYAALSNPARWSIYEATYRALEDVKATV